MREISRHLVPPAVGSRANTVGSVDMPRKPHVIQLVPRVVEGPLDIVRGIESRSEVIAWALVADGCSWGRVGCRRWGGGGPSRPVCPEMHCAPGFVGPDTARRKHWFISRLTFQLTQVERFQQLAQHAPGSCVPFMMRKIGLASLRHTPDSTLAHAPGGGGAPRAEAKVAATTAPTLTNMSPCCRCCWPPPRSIRAAAPQQRARRS
jgi:hypothetical protein